MNSFILFFTIDWKISLKFKTSKLLKLISFGVKILGSNFLITLFSNIRSLLIGRIYSTSQVAYFNKGKQFPQLIMETINGSIQSVLLPIFSDKQKNLDELVFYIRKFNRISTFLIFPSLLGLTVVAEPLVRLLLTDKWIEAVFYLQVFALAYLTQPTQIINNQALIAYGEAGVFLKLDLLRKLSEILFLMLALPLGVKLVAISALIANIFSMVLTMKPMNDILRYKYKDQILDFLYPLMISIIMGVVVFVTRLSIENIVLNLLYQITVGLLVFVSLSVLLKPRVFNELVELVANIYSKSAK
jgi:teichuronic acid exporter